MSFMIQVSLFIGLLCDRRRYVDHINLIYCQRMSKFNQLKEWTVPNAQKVSLRNRHNQLHRNSKKQLKGLIMGVQGMKDCKKYQNEKLQQIQVTDTNNDFDCFQNARRAMEFREDVSKNWNEGTLKHCAVFGTHSIDPPLLQQIGSSNVSKNVKKSLKQHRDEVVSQYSSHSNQVAPSTPSRKTAGSNKTAPTGQMKSQERVHTEEFWEQKNQTGFSGDEMRSENGSTSKYSLRKVNHFAGQRKSQFLVCLKYEDLIQPLKDTLLYSKFQLQSMRLKESRLDQRKMTNLLCNNIQNESEGCRCQPKCVWVNQWLSLIGYKQLREESCKMSLEEWNGYTRQIDKDIPRTQPQHPTFRNNKYLTALKEVLVGYCKLDSEIGYAQGMNFIAASLVFHSRNSYEALQVMDHVMRKAQFRRIYLQNFAFGRAAANKLSGELRRFAFDLYSHLISQGVQLQLFVMSWYFSMLGSFIPLEAMHLMVDKFIRRQFAGLNEVILTLLIYLRNELLHLQDNALMQAFSNQRLSLRALSIDWSELVVRSDNIQLSRCS